MGGMITLYQGNGYTVYGLDCVTFNEWRVGISHDITKSDFGINNEWWKNYGT